MAESWWRFAEAEVGDAVAVYTGDALPKKSTITARTTMQVTVDGIRYTRTRGDKVGDSGKHNRYSGSRSHIEKWTPEADARVSQQVAEVARRARQSKLIESVERVVAMMRSVRRDGYAGHSSSYPRTLTNKQLAALEVLAVDFTERAAAIVTDDA